MSRWKLEAVKLPGNTPPSQNAFSPHQFVSPICQPTPTIMNLSTRVKTWEKDSISCLSGQRPDCTYGQQITNMVKVCLQNSKYEHQTERHLKCSKFNIEILYHWNWTLDQEMLNWQNNSMLTRIMDLKAKKFDHKVTYSTPCPKKIVPFFYFFF